MSKKVLDIDQSNEEIDILLVIGHTLLEPNATTRRELAMVHGCQPAGNQVNDRLLDDCSFTNRVIAIKRPKEVVFTDFAWSLPAHRAEHHGYTYK